jgi:hypothetical protein
MSNTQEYTERKLFFRDKIRVYKEQHQRTIQALQNVLYCRLLVVFLAIAGVLYFANEKAFGPTALAAGASMLVLVMLQKKHNQLAHRQAMIALHIDVNQEEVARSDLDLSKLDNGQTYTDTKHPYGQDLDIVGTHSLFGLLNRTTTALGGRKLAAWLLAAADQRTIYGRQQAVRELSEKVAWRHDFEVEGRYQKGLSGKEGLLTTVRLGNYLRPLATKRKQPSNDYAGAFEELLGWLGEEHQRLKKYKGFYLLALAVLPVTFVVLFQLFLEALITNVNGPVQTRTGMLLLMLWGVLSLDKMLLLSLRSGLSPLRKFSPNAVPILNEIKALMKVTVKENFRDELLESLRLQCKTQGAGAELEKLVAVLEHFSRGPTTFDVIFLTDLYWLLKGESLKRKVTPTHHLINCAETVSELEALNSLAGFCHSNPSYTFPRISNEPYCFRSVDLGHPLIHSDKRITNDFAMEGRGTIALVTGSNMAGKSTFLRTVGINTVLALAGAPVCATKLEVSCLQVFTSMRTQDDLKENTSSFMAELRRINQLVHLLKSEEMPVLFLLDEILKGTNSADRHAGAKALARQLNRAGAYGLLSTHDLELVSLSHEMNLANYSFNSRIEEDKIWFDYHLTEGPCQTANATVLMRQMGIGV